jgi:outer membrane protein OmpA-like peptidoglycan-associated protein
MPTYAHKPLRVDYTKSIRWAIESISSVGVGYGGLGVGVALFDLVNRETHRAHRLALTLVSGSKGPLPFSGSWTESGYTNFNAPRGVSFKDFDGIAMKMVEVSVGLYSWDTIYLLGMAIDLDSRGYSIPGQSGALGTTEVLFGDGSPYGEPDLVINLPPIPEKPEPFRQYAKEDAFVYKMPVDVLFDFDKYLLKKGERTENALGLMGNLSDYRGTDEFRFLIIGHTDSVGTAEYNLRLSKKRAETVAKWLIEHNYLRAPEVKTIGEGASRPIESNSTEEGRAQNRRVEGVALRKRLWDSW